MAENGSFVPFHRDHSMDWSTISIRSTGLLLPFLARFLSHMSSLFLQSDSILLHCHDRIQVKSGVSTSLSWQRFVPAPAQDDSTFLLVLRKVLGK